MQSVALWSCMTRLTSNPSKPLTYYILSGYKMSPLYSNSFILVHMHVHSLAQSQPHACVCSLLIRIQKLITLIGSLCSFIAWCEHIILLMS
jgi:hypothetical protein